MSSTAELSEATAPQPMRADHRIVIVGAGFSGIGLAIRLKERGITDYVIFERAADVGGTWRDNSYPGAACDVPSLLYSFSFAPNHSWSRSFSPQPEIHQYLRDIADRFGIRQSIRFNEELEEARWNEQTQLWHIRTTSGEVTAQYLMAAMGGLTEPSIPALPGLENFQGTTFHSARWNHDYDLAGKRVAVIGTGASAIQFMPEIQKEAAQVDVYQRTAPWVLPRRDRDLTNFERGLYRRFPALQAFVRNAIYWGRETFAIPFVWHRNKGANLPERLGRKHLRDKIADPVLREKLTPDYAAGCKRILLSNDYYPAIVQANVELVTTGINEVTATGIVDNNGVEREVDAIVFGTGFHVTDYPHAHKMFGREGHSMATQWDKAGMQAYLGTTVAGFPNFFMLTGPNSGFGHTSMTLIMECQYNYLLDMLRTLDQRNVATVEVREDVQEVYNAELQARMPGTIWNSGGCKSWYLDKHGRNTTLWPDFAWKFNLRTRRFNTADYLLRRP